MFDFIRMVSTVTYKGRFFKLLHKKAVNNSKSTYTYTYIYMTNMTNRTKQVISTVVAVISKKFNMTNMTKKKVCLALGGLRAKRVRVGK